MKNTAADISDDDAASTAPDAPSTPHGWRRLTDPLSRLSTTRANARAGLVADSAVSLLLIGLGVHSASGSALAASATLLCGLLLFTLIEYCFHRWLFHVVPGSLERGHRAHHEDPLGHDSLPFFLPPLGMLLLAGLLALALPWTIAALLAGGLAAGYAAYGIGHTLIHSIRFRHPLPRRWAAAHHVHHRHPDRNFGVTSPLWDVLLGTRYVSKRNPLP